MKLRGVFQGFLIAGALLAVVGGGAIGVVTMVDPQMELLPRIEQGYRHIVFGFAFLTLFAVASALIETLSRIGKPAQASEPLPLPAPAAGTEAKPGPAPASRLEALYHEMKTYIDLEMWELALEKATLIVQDHAGTKEAELVSRNLNELRWKAEPKFVSMKEPLTADQEKGLREKGLAQMYQHVKTYMDLEMWELARQKSLTIMKNFPDSTEAAELTKVYETIEKKARESVATEAKAVES